MLVRNSFKCLVCGEDIDKGELICEECKGIGALDLVKLICRTEIKIPREYEVISIYKDRVLLAEHMDKSVPQPYVIWNIDYKGEVYSGSYFSDKNTAEKCYFNKLLNMG